MTRPCYITINQQALINNLNTIRTLTPSSRVIAMVKADAYGHGLSTLTKLIKDVDAFGVACLEEGLVVRQSCPKTRVVLLEGFFEPNELALIVNHEFDCVIHSVHQIEMLEQHRLNKPISVWLKVNTGMNRLGVPLSEAFSLWQRLLKNPNVQSTPKLMTHLASSDLPDDAETKQQIVEFNRLRQRISTEYSVANSAAILAWPETHLDWVRPGIMLYGISPFSERTGLEFGLQPVMTLHSEIIAIQDCKAGDRVGYGGTWTCEKPMRAGIVAVGYGDGYPRSAKSGTKVLVNGKITGLVGRVSMDMIAVDLSDQSDAKISDPVILWGDGLPIENVARSSDTIAYELVCNITPRVRRQII